MEKRRARAFLVEESLTVADIAVFSYVHLAEEAGHRLDEYPATLHPRPARPRLAPRTKEYVLFMHNAPDGGQPRPAEEWSAYFQRLNAEHVFEGGSSIGGGVCMNRSGASPEINSRIFGFICIRVRDLEHAKELVALNPVFCAGGTVEIRELE